MAQNGPQCDLVGWGMDNKQFWLVKIVKMSFLNDKPYPTHASLGIQTHDLPITQWCFFIPRLIPTP